MVSFLFLLKQVACLVVILDMVLRLDDDLNDDDDLTWLTSPPPPQPPLYIMEEENRVSQVTCLHCVAYVTQSITEQAIVT